MQGDSPKDNGYQMVEMDVGVTNDKPANPIIAAIKSSDVDELKLCLRKGGSVLDARDGKETALHCAAKHDDLEVATICAREIIEHISSNSSNAQLTKFINLEDSLGQNALVFAAWKGNDTLIDLLLSIGSTMGKSKKNETVFYYLAQLNDQEQSVGCAELCLNLRNYDNDPRKLQEYLDLAHTKTERTALIMAARFCNYKLIELLIRHGASALKEDIFGSTVLYYAVDNAYAEKAYECTATLMQPSLTENWEDIKSQLLITMNKYERFPIHIAARRGFPKVFKLLMKSCSITEGTTGYTALHLAASLGDPIEAEKCVQELLKILPEDIQIASKDSEHESARAEYLSGTMGRKEFMKMQDTDGCTALYLAAQHENVGACKALLLAGAGLDIKSKRGKTALQKVYEKIPQAVMVLLDEGLSTSGYVAKPGAVKLFIELNYAPILGYSTNEENVYKETQDLANVRYAEFDMRKEILDHPLVRVFIFKKWEKIKFFFTLFRLFHIFWFIFNFFLDVTVYRVRCPPVGGTKTFSWTSLRPTGEQDNETISLADCDIGTDLKVAGTANLILAFFFMLSRIHQIYQRFHWLYRPVKSFRGEKEHPSCWDKSYRTVSHYVFIIFQILPVWPLVIGSGILFLTLPTVGVRPFSDFVHYLIAGIMGFLIWVCIYLEFGKIPNFRVYIILLKKSTTTLLWAISITAPLLCGFATVFVIFMPGEATFSSALQSFVKVITFMIGELDYNGTFYGDDNEGIFAECLRLALAIFVVFVVLLLVNFLIGLAAEEIRNFRERKEVWKLCVQLEQIVTLESFLDESVPWFGRNFLRQKLMLMPPLRRDNKIISQKRTYTVHLPSLPQRMRKELHSLHLKTIREEM